VGSRRITLHVALFAQLHTRHSLISAQDQQWPTSGQITAAMFESDMPEPVIPEEYLRQSCTSLYLADRDETGASISAAAVETLRVLRGNIVSWG
jgi:hypothetical protein